MEGLEITSQGNYEFGHTQDSEYYSQDHFTTRDLTNQFTEVDIRNGHPVGVIENHLPTSGGIKKLADSHLYSYSVRNMISYSNSFKGFDYKVLAGNEIYSLEGNNYANWLWGFDPDLLTSQSINLAALQEGVYGYNGNIQNLSEEYAPTYAETLERYVSYFGTADISYKDKYDVFASVRLDQTNLLTNASKFRNNPSWSVGAKWDINEESFFKADFVDALSLRTSYGLTGNIDKSTGPDIVAEADWWIPSLNYLIITNPSNPSLGWEKTYSWNVGVDYMLFNNRISGSFDFYHKLSKGLLADVDIDPTTGWSSIFKNSATVQNVGFDWTLNGYTWSDYLYNTSDDDDHYNNYYHVIYLCNYILNNLADAPDGTRYTRSYVEGAARFHRAFAYFTLVNMYAKHYDKNTADTDLGVPLMLEADPNLTIGRATVQQIYDQIFTDLNAAKDLLTFEKPEYTFRPNRTAVYALLARIYLYQGEYALCREAARTAREQCDEPSDYNQYELEDVNPDFGIWGYPYNGWEEEDVICYKGDGYGPNIDEDYNLSDDLIALFDKETDLRWLLFITTYPAFSGDDPEGDTPRTAAYCFPNNRGLNVGELYLTEAEACARENQTDDALYLLNEVARKRHVEGTYVDVTERDTDKLLQLILDERRRDGIYKGTRWFDLKRLNKDPRFAKTITHTLYGETYTLAPDDNHWVLPIPLNAINLNPLLEQNPR